MNNNKVTATLVPEPKRMLMLPKHFGPYMRVETFIYHQLSELATDYKGAWWDFYELSNGGFYMAPDTGKPLRLVSPNGFDEIVAPDSAGIIACLFAYCAFASRYEPFIDHYHWLREYAVDCTDSSRILRAID